jgi:hypothetical protein
MKKFTILLLFFLCLSFNIIGITTLAVTPSNVLKEGVYKLSDLNISEGNLYDITNISPKEDAYIIVFDENFVIMQSIRLSTSIKSFNLVPLKTTYQLVVLGKTELYINPRPISNEK